MENLRVFQKFAKSSTKPKIAKSNKAVIYTRVSTKGQAENNASLETQKTFCEEYAKRNQFEIDAYFGGTYESAKKDDRKEFQKMLRYVRANNDISYIIVYAYDRFSRTGASGANISNQLKEKGILTLSATQHVDFTNPASSVLGEGVFHLMSHLENVNRTTTITNGMRSKLKKGYWINTVPFGYTNLNPGKGKVPDIVINEDGKLLKLAFQWKLHKNMTYNEIADRLNKKGLKIRAKKLSDYFRNPFYCGVIVHNLLDEPILGKHEQLVSRRDFAKINDLLYKNGKKYAKADENLPLKQFIKAVSCGTKYTGYLVKRKNLYYYKNNRIGSKENRSAKVMHQKFEELLRQFQIKDQKYMAPLKSIMKYTFVQEHQEQLNELKIQEKKTKELQNKLNTIEERFVLREITDEQFYKFEEKFKRELKSIKVNNSNNSFNLSNLEKSIELATKISCNLQELWSLGDLETKRAVQQIVFPEGILFDYKNDCYRTNRINSLFAIIPSLSNGFGSNKNGTTPKNKELSRQVLKAGLEPARPYRPLDFKSNVSTNSTTSAWYILSQSERRDLNPRPSPWQGDALPLSYFRSLFMNFAIVIADANLKQF